MRFDICENKILNFSERANDFSSSTQKGAPSKLDELEHPNRIIGGYRVNITDVPWQVSLQLGGSFHFCGGAVIAPQWILTAAHCIDGQRPSAIKVRVGATGVYNEGLLIQAEKLIQHREYDTRVQHRFDYDFGLIKLASELEFNDKVSPIDLAAVDRNETGGTIVSVNGWGLTSQGGVPSKFLRGVKLPLVDQAECKKAYGQLNAITNRMICAGYTQGGQNSKFNDQVLFISKERQRKG